MFHAWSVTGSFAGNDFSVFQHFLVSTLRLGEVWTAAGLLLFMPDMKAGHARRAPESRPVLDGKKHLEKYQSCHNYVFNCVHMFFPLAFLGDPFSAFPHVAMQGPWRLLCIWGVLPALLVTPIGWDLS